MDAEVCYQEHLVCKESICVVCTERKSNAKLDCGHDEFCMSCVGTWFETNTSCPLCRARVAKVWTSDVTHKKNALEEEVWANFIMEEGEAEEVFLEILDLVEKYVDRRDQNRYMKTIYSIVKKYPPKQLLYLFHMYKGQIELGIQEHPLPRLLENYYKYKTMIGYWISSLL